MSSGREGVATTRARKRKAGERDSSWDVVANNDDVRFKHIITPRLNRTDLKFVSSEYSTEEEHERLRNALALLENKPLPLWRLFREAVLNGGACRDIVEKHVMCKLNGTDLKFFYDVNTETRKLIKRSSRKGELKEKFKVSEMSSISTLEFAWEHFPWEAYDYDVEEETAETYFCRKVAQTNKLELLKWAREEKECEWVCHRNISGNRDTKKAAAQTIKTKTKKHPRLRLVLFKANTVGIAVIFGACILTLNSLSQSVRFFFVSFLKTLTHFAQKRRTKRSAFDIL